MRPGALDPGNPAVAARCEAFRKEIAAFARRFASRGGYDPAALESDAMLGLLQAARVWDGIGAFRPLAYTVSKRRMIDGLRIRRAVPTETMEQLADAHESSDYLAMVEALRALSPVRAEVLLRRLHGESNSEIGVAMRMSTERVSAVATAKGRRVSVCSALTERELCVLELAAEGLDTWAIALVLSLSRETVKTHTKHIRHKLGASTIGHAIAIGFRDSLLA